MRKITFMLCMLFCMIYAVQAQGVTDLSQLDNSKTYTLRSERAFLLYCESMSGRLCSSNGKLAGTVTFDATDSNQQFRIEKDGNSYYLYSVGASMYVNADGSYGSSPSAVLTLENVGGNYPWKLLIGSNGMNSQSSGQTNEGIIFNGWTSTDAGNCYQIEEVIVGPRTYTIDILGFDGGGVTYNGKEYKDGDTFEAEEVKKSDIAISPVDGMIAVVNIDGTTIYASYMDAATKFYTIKNGVGGYVGLGEGYHENGNLLLNNNTIPMDNKGLWTFVEEVDGGYKIYNYSTGLSKVLGMTGSEANARASMVSPISPTHTIVFDGNIKFDGTDSRIKLKGSENNYWNKRGNYLALWNSVGATGNDTGSMFYLEEADHTIGEIISVNPADYPEDQLFLIMNVTGGNYLTANSNITVDIRDEANPNQSFYFVRTETANQYHIKSYSGKYIKSAHQNSWTMVAVTETSENTLHKVVSVGDGVYTIGMVSNNNLVIGPNYVTNGSEVYSDKAITTQNGKWYILPITTQEIPVRVGTEFADAGIYYKVTSTTENTIEVISTPSGYNGDLVIPETVMYGGKAYKVTSLATDAFSYSNTLTSITIPNGVTSISDNAFYYCEKLTAVTLPESLATIGEYAFYGCSSLSSLAIPQSVTSIGTYAFYGCSSLTAITIPEGVSSIGNSTFSGCKKISTITLPESLTSIGNNAFYNCNQLKSIAIPKSVTSIGSSAFYDCNSLKSITIPSDVTSIGSYAFQGCDSLANVTLPDTLSTLSYYVFGDCGSLKELTIGTRIESIDSYVLYNCNLSALLCYAIIPPSVNTYSFYQSTISTIYVPAASIDLYKAAEVWKEYNIQAISDYTANLLTVSYEYGVGVTTVTLEASLTGSKIYYTLDGSNPLEAGILYETPFEISDACTLKAIAVSEGFDNSNLIDEHVIIRNMPTINNFSFGFTKDVTYDGNSHQVHVYATNGMGAVTIIYKDANGVESTEAPSAVGSYEVSINVAEGTLFYPASFENVATFTISVMDDVEWNTLQELYTQTGGEIRWYYKWNMDGGIAAAASFYGVTYRNGHIVGLNLSGNNLVGELPISVLALPYLEDLYVNNNSLTGDIGKAIQAYVALDEQKGSVRNVDISYNGMVGNIGAITKCCPNLEYLYARGNHLTDVYPILPETMTVSLTDQTIDAPFTWDGMLSYEANIGGLINMFPTLLFYNHTEQGYTTPVWRLQSRDSNNAWAVKMSVDTSNYTVLIETDGSNRVYYGASGDTLDVTTLSPVVSSGSKAKIVYMFEEGDADFSNEINVMDLQAIINYIFKEYQYNPFNHTAANIQSKDSRIDVLDVIAFVDLLMSDTLSTATSSFARARTHRAINIDEDAYLYWENNHLILETEKDIAALDIVVTSNEALQWNNTLGMTTACSNKEDCQRIISYSMSGKYIPQGKHTLLTTATPCAIESAVIADRAAQEVNVVLRAPVATGVGKVDTEDMRCRLNGGWLQLVIVSEYNQLVWEVYSTEGSLLGNGTLQDATEGVYNLFTTDRDRAMIVVVRDNNGIVLTQKINTTK